MRKYEQIVPTSTLPRASSCDSTIANQLIIPASYIRSTSSPGHNYSTIQHQDDHAHFQQWPIVRRGSATFHRLNRSSSGLSTFLRSLVSVVTFPFNLPTCGGWLTIPNQLSITPSLGRKVTGTLYGRRRGHVSFAVQESPRSQPVLLIELAVSTSTLVRYMSSGLLRIALECEKERPSRVGLYGEPSWTMYCNGRKCGYAVSRACNESDWHVLSTVQTVSVGAGVIPVVDDGQKGGASEGELLYMRARFERVVGNHDSEAFYMLNPDGNGGPELSLFLLRM